MEIQETNVKKLDMTAFTSNVNEFIKLLQSKRFKTITLSSTDNAITLRAYFHDHTVVCFEIGNENVYLKGTPFWSKDSKEQLVDLVFKLYYLD